MASRGNKASKVEFIAFASGKGGTGKTLMASCLGYALIRAGHRVLLVDADLATDGLSLFLLGPKGMHQISEFTELNTFAGIIRNFQSTGYLSFEARRLNRDGIDRTDHGISYEAIISGKSLYGDALTVDLALPSLDRDLFRKAIISLLSEIRESGQYDYVLIDTRGGFGFDSTDVCAIADSFIVVTDPDVTSFYQDRNLVRQISAAAKELGRSPVLRSIIVNRAIDGLGDREVFLDKLEVSFRLELEKAFPLKFSETHAIPADLEVLRAYKSQMTPYLTAPASLFSFATLSAFSDIMGIVTSRWTAEQVQRWNSLIGLVSEAIKTRNKVLEGERAAQRRIVEESPRLRQTVAQRTREIAQLEAAAAESAIAHARDLSRFASFKGKWRRLHFIAPLILLSLSFCASLYLKVFALSISWWVLVAFGGSIMVLAILSSYSAFIGPTNNRSALGQALLNFVGERIIQFGADRGIGFRLNVLMTYRPAKFLFLRKYFRMIWGSRQVASSPDAAMRFGADRGVPGEVLKSGRTLLVNFEEPANQDQTKWGFTKRDLIYLPPYTMMLSLPIFQLDKNGYPTGRILGTLNLDSVSSGSFDKMIRDNEILAMMEELRDVVSRIASV